MLQKARVREDWVWIEIKTKLSMSWQCWYWVMDGRGFIIPFSLFGDMFEIAHNKEAFLKKISFMIRYLEYRVQYPRHYITCFRGHLDLGSKFPFYMRNNIMCNTWTHGTWKEACVTCPWPLEACLYNLGLANCMSSCSTLNFGDCHQDPSNGTGLQQDYSTPYKLNWA